MCKPVSVLGDGLSGLMFMIDTLCILRYDEYVIIGQCASSTAACKFIQQMSTWINPYNVRDDESKESVCWVIKK